MHLLVAALLLLAPSHSTMTFHGGAVVMSAMANEGNVLTFRVDCNTGPPCLPVAPHDQFGNFFKLKARKTTATGTRERYRLKVPKNMNVEIITTGTEGWGNPLNYSIVMDSH